MLSEKDGWRHGAYVCSRDSKEHRRLMPGDYDIIEKAKVDEEERDGFTSTHLRKTERGNISIAFHSTARESPNG